MIFDDDWVWGEKLDSNVPHCVCAQTNIFSVCKVWRKEKMILKKKSILRWETNGRRNDIKFTNDFLYIRLTEWIISPLQGPTDAQSSGVLMKIVVGVLHKDLSTVKFKIVLNKEASSRKSVPIMTESSRVEAVRSQAAS